MAWLVDIRPTEYLNNLNLKLLGSNKLFKNLFNDGASFKNQTRAIRKAVVLKKVEDFQHLKQRVAANDLNKDKYTNKVAERFNAS